MNKQSTFDYAIETDRNAKSERDSNKAFELYCKAFEEGDPRAAAVLGYLYEHGINCERDNNRSEDFYQHAASVNEPWGMYAMGRILLSRGEHSEAIRLLTDAGLSGIPFAYLLLAEAFESGTVGAPYPARALEYYCKAADLGNNIGRHLAAGRLRDGSKADYEKALEYLRLGCDEGDGWCCWRLAVTQLARNGLDSNVLNMAENAANLGVAEAAEWCGQVLVKGGNEIEQDKIRGERFLRKAASEGSTRAKYLLGLYILKGLLNSSHVDEGIQLCREASNRGDEDAREVIRIFDERTGNT